MDHFTPRQSGTPGALILGLALIAGTPVFAVDNLWTGAVSSDWNNNANWSDPHAFGSPHVPTNGAGHPVDEDAVINTTVPNIATITVDTVVKPRDNKIGLGVGTVGRVDHLAGFHSTGAGNWTFVGEGGGTGTYNLANTAAVGGPFTSFGLGSGSYSTLGEQLRIGAGAGSVGTFNMNTSGTVASDRVFIGYEGGTGTFNLDSGIWNNARSFMVGEAAGVGFVNQSGGDVNVGGDWFGIGYGLGGPPGSKYTMTGGTLNITPIAEIGADREGTMDMSGDALIATNIADFVVGLRNGGNGTLNVGGNATVAAGGSNSFVGRDTGSTGTINLAGNGSITVNAITIGENGAGFVNQSGGSFVSNNWFTVGGPNIPAGAFSKYTGTGGTVTANVVEVGMRRQGEMEVSGANITANDTLFIGHEGNGAGLLTHTAGSITAGGTMMMGRNGGISAVYNHTGGTLNVNALEMGNGATTPVFTTTGDLNVGNAAPVAGETNVRTSALLVGGTLNVAGNLDLQGGGSIELGAGGNLNVNNGLAPGTAGAANLNVNGGLATINGLVTRAGLGTGGANVGPGGTLEGNGSIAGPVNVFTGGTIEPGTNGAGILGIGDFTLTSGAHLTLEIGGLTPGATYDQLSVTGLVSLSGDLAGSGFIGGFQSLVQPGDTFYVIRNDGADPIIGTLFDGLVPIPDGGGINIGGVPFTVSYDHNGDLGAIGNDLALIAVPEPASLLGLLGGFSALALRRRRRA